MRKCKLALLHNSVSLADTQIKKKRFIQTFHRDRRCSFIAVALIALWQYMTSICHMKKLIRELTTSQFLSLFVLQKTINSGRNYLYAAIYYFFKEMKPYLKKLLSFGTINVCDYTDIYLSKRDCFKELPWISTWLMSLISPANWCSGKAPEIMCSVELLFSGNHFSDLGLFCPLFSHWGIACVA